MKQQRALWVSTSMSTRGGVSSFVREMTRTPIWAEWNIRHVATHRDGGMRDKAAAFATGLVRLVVELVLHRPAVMHVHISSHGSFYRKYLVELISRLFRVPVVLHVHGSDFKVFYDESNRPLRWAIRDSLSGSAVVVALGQSWADLLNEIAPSARVVVVPNCVRPLPAIEAPRSEGPIRVLFLGQVGERKGAFTLLEAWRRALDDGGLSTARLIMAGDGEVDRARRMVDDLDIGASVEVLGWIDSADAPELVRTSDVLVLPSHREGQPMAILESMANGLCVITSPVGGIPDLVDESCAILVPPGDTDALAVALGRVVHEPETRERLGTAAWQRVRDEFDVDVVWRRFDEIYREVTR